MPIERALRAASLLPALFLTCSALPAHAAVREALLIEQAYVMTFDAGRGDLPRADVLVRDGRIVAIGERLDADGATRIDGRGQVLLPGFVDTHSHLWVTTMRGAFRNGADSKFFPVSNALGAVMTADDTAIAMRGGAVELLDGGITTTADFFDNVRSPAHADAGLKALQDSGIRARLYLGGPDKTTRHPIDLDTIERLATTTASAPDPRVRMGLAWRLPRDRTDAANWTMRQREFDIAMRLGLPVQVHVSGEPAPMFDALIQRGYLRPGVEVVHATDASPAQLAALARSGGSLALTPVSEHRVGYGLTRLDRFSSVRRQGLGIDGNSLSGNGDMFAALRLAALTWSGGVTDETAPDPRALLELATLRGAEALRMEDEIGSITVGKRADLQLVDLRAPNLAGFAGGDPAALIVYSARPDNVSTVIVDGVVRKRDGQLVGVDVTRLVEEARSSAAGMRERAAASGGG